MEIFSENLIGDQLQVEDYEILVDCLISILSVENKEIRKLVEETFKHFLPVLKGETINLIVSEIFTPLDLTDNLLVDETMESDTDADLSEENQDIHI